MILVNNFKINQLYLSRLIKNISSIKLETKISKYTQDNLL